MCNRQMVIKMAKSQKFRIKDWALEDRPREKLIAKGIGSLSDAELIAVLIGSGNRYESAVDLSRRILQGVNNNLNQLGKKNLKSLTAIKGIGEAKAVSIIAALELGRRRKLADLSVKTRIRESKKVFELMQPILADLPHEEFWVLYLNRANIVIDKKRISQGGISGTVIDVRLIMKNGIEHLASSVILCHNHPSGNLKPSDADLKITEKMKKAGDILDIKVLDHLIIADNTYFSMADEGLI